jgi:hypothetical protein
VSAQVAKHHGIDLHNDVLDRIDQIDPSGFSRQR